MCDEEALNPQTERTATVPCPRCTLALENPPPPGRPARKQQRSRKLLAAATSAMASRMLLRRLATDAPQVRNAAAGSSGGQIALRNATQKSLAFSPGLTQTVPRVLSLHRDMLRAVPWVKRAYSLQMSEAVRGRSRPLRRRPARHSTTSPPHPAACRKSARS